MCRGHGNMSEQMQTFKIGSVYLQEIWSLYFLLICMQQTCEDTSWLYFNKQITNRSLITLR